MKKDPYVNNQIGIVVDYLDNNPESLITITPDIKSIFQTKFDLS